MMAQRFAIFDTAIGPCGIVWNDYGIIGVQLPEATEGRTRSRMQKRFRGGREASPSPEIAATIGKIVALLNGEDADFSDTKLDIKALPEFNLRVYRITSAIPRGAVMTTAKSPRSSARNPKRPATWARRSGKIRFP